jgi:hypothetical protein
MRSKTPHRPAALVMAAVLGASVVAAPVREAHADDVSSTGKGIGGGALLGGEVVWIVEGIAGVHSGWAYAIGGILGAGGGGVGGYFVEKGSSDGKAPMYMLAGGLALVIPAVVLMLNGTRYQPEEGATEDRTPVGPPAEPGAPGTSITGQPNAGAAPTPAPPPPAPPPTEPPPQSLLDLHKGSFRIGVPLPDVRPAFTVSETVQYGLRSGGTELRMPVLHVTF